MDTNEWLGHLTGDGIISGYSSNLTIDTPFSKSLFRFCCPNRSINAAVSSRDTEILINSMFMLIVEASDLIQAKK